MPSATAPAPSPSSSPPASAPDVGVARPAPGAGFAVYVHWPFCLAKCPYCDFNSHVRAAVDQGRWGAALSAEIDHAAAETPGREVTSVFFGGGTPSLMAPATVATVIERIARRWSLARDAEITLEANPTSAEARSFEGFRAAGVNRLSLGVQALDDGALKSLGRQHGVAEACAALELAQATFPRTSFDLIYARPGQELAAWRTELGEALEMAEGHLSLYQLTIEAGTAFHQAWREGRLAVPDQDLAAAFYEATCEACAAAGYQAYEISNYARPGEPSRHNLTYWRYGDYVGVGPGAHGRFALEGRRHAVRRLRKPESWLATVERQGHGREADEVLAPSDAGAEMVMMGLRLAEGVARAAFESAIGVPLAGIVAPAAEARLKAGGFLADDDRRLRATPRGRLVLNTVLAELLI